MGDESMCNETQTPDHAVAERVVVALQKEGLIREARVNSFRSKLATGKLSAEDWSLEIELALARKDTKE